MAARTPPPRPLIGINTDYFTPKSGAPYARVNSGYFDAILAAGGMPILLPPMKKDHFADLATLLDMVSGGGRVGGLALARGRRAHPPTNAIQPMPARREESDRTLL